MKYSAIVLGFTVLALWAQPSAGQAPTGRGPGGGGPGGGGMSILGLGGAGGLGALMGMGGMPGGEQGPVDKLALTTQRPVQRELDLSDDQIADLNSCISARREAMASWFELELDEIQKEIVKQTKTTDGDLADILKPDQLKRLNQIAVQRRGVRALTDPDVAKQLTLTTEQKNKIKKIDDMSNDVIQSLTQMAMSGGSGGGMALNIDRDALTQQFQRQNGARGQGGQRPGNNPGGNQAGGGGQDRNALAQTMAQSMTQSMQVFQQINELQTARDEKLLSVLTVSQKGKWKQLQGEPFASQAFDPADFARPQRGGNGDSANSRRGQQN